MVPVLFSLHTAPVVKVRYKMRSLDSSPVVNNTWQKRREAVVARKSFFSSAAIVVLLGLIYLDINYNTISSYLEVTHWLWHVFEMVVTVVLLVKVLLNLLSLVLYVWTYLFGGPVDLTDDQRKLLGVQQNEHGFRTPPPQQKTGQQTPDTSLIFSSSFSGTDGSPHSVFRSLSPGFTSATSSSPAHTQLQQTAYSPSMSPFSGSFGHSFDMHQSLNSTAPSPQYDGSFRARHGLSTPRSASNGGVLTASPYDRIKDQRTLHSYLQEQEEKELKSRQAAQETLNMSSSSFWSYGTSALDFTHTLRKYAYQLASHLPQSTTKASTAEHSVPGVDEVWNKYGVTENDLYVWTEKLRKWLSATIVSRLSKKIRDVNKQLQRIGCEDMQVGEMSVATLKQLALTKGGMVPALNNLVPYLDFFANQEYLVRRIQDLSTGSMSDFAWNKGGSYGKLWAEHLITDSSLVMQLLCTYLDSRLPAQPHYMDGKVFTAQHFIKTPDKPDMQRKDNLLVYQTSINPPHFQVVIGTQTYNLPKGRNNMFQAILLFFYHIKTKEQGMLGRVNLGLSGLNIMWIFD
ncbi:transmembrane protein 209-like [Babylonia areolata]|uniref:transmembrane protein 209-like n=1 Tax=Babylonia areolata TaxID=304850 RepID=UPI003FD31682